MVPHLSAHLIPRLGHWRLDGDEDIQLLEAARAGKSNKTVNNMLTRLIERMPAKVRLLEVTRKEAWSWSSR